MFVRIGDRIVGDGHPCLIVAEIGINHNGSIDTAIELLRAAKEAGADAVKLQVGDPGLYVNPAMRTVPRDTPWGVLPYIEYRRRMELSDGDLRRFSAEADKAGMIWFASALDSSAIPRLMALKVPCIKIASPHATHTALLDHVRATGLPVILSTGMTTPSQTAHAVSRLSRDRLILLHCTSAYPTPPAEINLRAMNALRALRVPVGYSGHEIGLATTVAAVALGACMVERHLTLSRAMWGSDHGASVEPHGIRRLIRDIRTVEEALGDGRKRVYDSERANMRKFRWMSAA